MHPFAVGVTAAEICVYWVSFNQSNPASLKGEGAVGSLTDTVHHQQSQMAPDIRFGYACTSTGK